MQQIPSLSLSASIRGSRLLLCMLALNVVRSFLLIDRFVRSATHVAIFDPSIGMQPIFRSFVDCPSPGTMVAVVIPGTISKKCWMKRPAHDETVQFVGNHDHCCSAASHGCGIFQSLPCCWLSHTSSHPQVHTCSSWNTSCASNSNFLNNFNVCHGSLSTQCADNMQLTNQHRHNLNVKL